ncbi:RagB/SusD family nutrient uptake outer membrane protein [Olivibacter ginsenosidimutans]|uniref:RagB/SusD family nutrient uptake outer membrane protein n=2 Tax=Olivibacter ginsenosidimutans TaxID=1176537 RepID=A0ABP9C2Q7_9SPHI
MVAGLISLSACESRLDIAPVTNLTDATFYRTEEDAKSALGACYASIYNPDIFHDLVTTDDAIPFLTGDAARPLVWRYDITPETNYLRFFPGAYQSINRSNIVIKRLPDIPMDEQLRNRYIAEAKFLRALAYLTLVRFYGGVPLVTEPTEGAENLELARAAVADVYALIEADLQEAEQVLPPKYTGADVGRATSNAAKALMARMYLFRAGTDANSPFWQQAAQKTKEVIDEGSFGLYDTFADAFALSARGGKENIFEIQYLTDVSGHGLGRGYGVRGAPIYPGGGAGIARPTASLYQLYTEADQRRDVTFITSYTYNGKTTNLSITDPNPANAISFQKLWDKTAQTNGGEGTSVPLIRFSDVLLMYAEAQNEVNHGPDALAYEALNRVRTRAGLNSYAGLDYQAFKEAVWQERRLEFAFENMRWFDLVRTGRLIDAVKAENSFDRNALIKPFHTLLPIPQQDIDNNPLLEQNPGYEQ